MAYVGSNWRGYTKTGAMLCFFGSEEKNRRDERWDQFVDLNKMVAKKKTRTHIKAVLRDCSEGLSTGYGTVSPMARIHSTFTSPLAQYSRASKD